MFNLASYAALALSAASVVSGLVVPRSEPPAGWATDYLEPYTVYHTRYLAIGCNNQHGKPFFDQCCHPLLATESLETARPAQCIPSASASSSAARAEPTSTINPPVDGGDDGEDDDENCEDDDEGDDSLASSFSQAPAPPPTTSQAPAAKPTTSQAPAPPPITSQAPAPQPTTTQAPQPTSEAPAPKPTTSQAAPTPENKSPPPSGGVITGGDATFFFQNGVAGACGTVHSDNDLIAAIDSRRYGNTGVKSELCGKQVRITNPENNKSVTVTIADACPTCNNENSIDLSRAAFETIASFDQGLVGITWSFV